MMSSKTIETEGRWAEILHAPYLLPLITLALGVALMAFNIFFLITALPTVVSALEGRAYITWASSLYLIFAIAAGAAAGLAKDRFGARHMFLIATSIFIAGTAVCAASPNMPVLLAGRALQGGSAGMIEGLSYAMIPVLFPPRLVPKVFGVEATMWVLAAFGGPAVAGFLTTHLSWRWALVSGLPLAVAFLFLVLRIVPRETPVQTSARFPGLRLALIATGLLLVTLSSVETPMRAILFNGVAIALIVCGFVVDRSAAQRLFPRGSFGLALPFGLGLWTIVLMAIPESAVSAYLPYAIQNAWGYPAAFAGAIHSVLAFAWSFSQIAVSTFASPRLRHELIWIGTVLLAAGLAIAHVAVTQLSLPMVVLAQIFIGCAFGINWGNISQLLMEAAPADERSLASALLPTAQSGGFALGASLCGLTGNLLGFPEAKGVVELQKVTSQVFLIGAFAALPVIPLAYFVVRKAKSYSAASTSV